VTRRSALQPAQQFRLFVALTTPDQVKSALLQAQAELRRALSERAARWARSEQFHLTLRFLGNVDASRVEELVELTRAASRPFAPLRLTAARIGFFPDARFPRVIWAGISDQDDRLGALWRAVQTATQSFTKEPAETEFTGHVTLARINRLRHAEALKIAAAAGKFYKTVLGEWTADQLELMRSELLPQGARHSSLAALPMLGR
jgi:2'-5' RNA ligase